MTLRARFQHALLMDTLVIASVPTYAKFQPAATGSLRMARLLHVLPKVPLWPVFKSLMALV